MNSFQRGELREQRGDFVHFHNSDRIAIDREDAGGQLVIKAGKVSGSVNAFTPRLAVRYRCTDSARGQWLGQTHLWMGAQRGHGLVLRLGGPFAASHGNGVDA